MILNRVLEFINDPFFLFVTTGWILEGAFFVFIFYTLLWVVKKAKYAIKLQTAGTTMQLMSLYWIFFVPYSYELNAICILLFFIGSLIMAIALTEELITESIRARFPQSEKAAG
ncbi:hypothetical protein [Domibacillus epiphyticus]|uniref:Uncharacterized protein n=1 Tax=Domibacillus epiphyticus TaxID=1714355 RepID=A0A1V2A8E6_9BACI|nr:hypothetical protein [Domibacillus epiphyticus]OMP67227.1 hypothetical protein BTO28_07800 [Domibacillus epiphyticus]